MVSDTMGDQLDMVPARKGILWQMKLQNQTKLPEKKPKAGNHIEMVNKSHVK